MLGHGFGSKMEMQGGCQAKLEREERCSFQLPQGSIFPYLQFVQGSIFPNATRFRISNYQKVPYFQLPQGSIFPIVTRFHISNFQKVFPIATRQSSIFPIHCGPFWTWCSQQKYLLVVSRSNTVFLNSLLTTYSYISGGPRQCNGNVLYQIQVFLVRSMGPDV